jgi:hypothetical protein
VTDLYFVPPTTKVDRWFFINSILKLIVEKDIRRLYPGEEHKVVLHFDSAGSHTTPEVYSWLDERNVKYIRKEEWLSNSSDLSHMEFGPNGIFKQILFGKKATGLDGLKQVARQVWADLPLATCVNTMKSWPGRVKKMIESGLSDRKFEKMIFFPGSKEFSQKIGSTLLAHPVTEEIHDLLSNRKMSAPLIERSG